MGCRFVRAGEPAQCSGHGACESPPGRRCHRCLTPHFFGTPHLLDQCLSKKLFDQFCRPAEVVREEVIDLATDLSFFGDGSEF